MSFEPILPRPLAVRVLAALRDTGPATASEVADRIRRDGDRFIPDGRTVAGALRALRRREVVVSQGERRGRVVWKAVGP